MPHPHQVELLALTPAERMQKATFGAGGPQVDLKPPSVQAASVPRFRSCNGLKMALVPVW